MTITRGITITFVIQTCVLTVGWMIAAFVVRHGPTWTEPYWTFGKWFHHYGMSLILVAIAWTLLASRAIRESTRYCDAILACGPLLVVAFFVMAVFATVLGSGGGTIMGVVE